MKKFISLTLALIFCFALCLSVGCNKTGYSYWQVKKIVSSNDENDVMTQFLEVTLKESNIKEIWLNVSDMAVEETAIGYVFGSSSNLSKVTVSKNFLKNSDGWYKIKASAISKTLKITFIDQMKVNEIVFVDEKDKVMEFDFIRYVIRPSFTSQQQQEHTKAALEEAGESNSPLCAFDEQDKFDLSYANKVFEKAEADLNEKDK